MNTEHKLYVIILWKILLLSIILFTFFYFETILGLVICPSPNIAKY